MAIVRFSCVPEITSRVRIGGPGESVFVARVTLRLDVANQLPQVTGDRLELRHVEVVRGAQQPFATEQRAHALEPAPPAQLRDHDRQQRHDAAETEKQIEDVPPRFLAAARDKTHVVNEHQTAVRVPLGVEVSN